VTLIAALVAVLPFIHGGVQTDVTSVLGEIESIGRAIGRSEQTLHDLSRETELMTSRASLADVELASARLRYDAAFVVYRERVRALARLPLGTLFVLFGESDSLSDVLRASKLLRRVATYDHGVQERLRVEAEHLRTAVAKADEDKRALEHVIARFRETRNALAAQRRARVDVIKAALASPDRRAGVQRELASARSNLAGMLQRLQPTASTRFSDLWRGKLPWPVVGSMTGRFGEPVHRELGTTTTRQGIAIGAVAGDPVQAVASGRVVYAGWMRGYGQMVLLDHGEHYHTLVAHLDRVAVHVGQQVAAGAVLGHVGESGWQEGPGLAFELRHRSGAVDPTPWLRH
jgi:septal ring factor EnvC (AmiA/AmiB activator)